MRKFFKEFGQFIARGNVFDMAVGLIIATAFNKIVSSMVNDILMPLITWATGASSLQALSIPLRYEIVDGVKVATLSWAYGAFIQTVIDFLIIALSVFIMVKVVNVSRKQFKLVGDFAKTQTSKEIKREKQEVKKLAKEKNKPFKTAWKDYLLLKEDKAKQEKLAQEEQEKLKKVQEEKEHPSTEVLLKEIRDLLKEKSNETSENNADKENK